MTVPPNEYVTEGPPDSYNMDPTPYDWSPILQPFTPPLPREGQVFFASFFGDVFVEDKEGACWWINGLEERVERIAINRDKAVERMNAEHVVMLKTRLKDQLTKADRLVPPGMIYGLKIPIAEGGKYHPDNIGTAPVADAFAYMGARFQEANAPKPTPPMAMPPEDDFFKVKAKDDKKGLWGKKK